MLSFGDCASELWMRRHLTFISFFNLWVDRHARGRFGVTGQLCSSEGAVGAQAGVMGEPEIPETLGGFTALVTDECWHRQLKQ